MNAFRAVYTNFRNVPTRKCVQIIFEVPTEQFNDALKVLGGVPDPSTSKWFGIAPLATPQPSASPAAGAKRDWRDLAPQQQAGIRCDEPAFEQFLKEERHDDWAEAQSARDAVCLICGVDSRAELATNQKARIIWHQLDSQYQAWKALEHA